MLKKTTLRSQINNEGRTIKWLAQQCGVKPHTVSSYLSGRRSPSPSVMILMAKALNCSVEDLTAKNKPKKLTSN